MDTTGTCVLVKCRNDRNMSFITYVHVTWRGQNTVGKSGLEPRRVSPILVGRFICQLLSPIHHILLSLFSIRLHLNHQVPLWISLLVGHFPGSDEQRPNPDLNYCGMLYNWDNRSPIEYIPPKIKMYSLNQSVILCNIH